MPLINFYTSDPGEDLLTAATQINIVEKLAVATRYARGRGTVGLVGAVVNDRGVPNVPVQLDSMRDLETRWGGFKSWLGDAVPVGVEGTVANEFSDRGKNSGYLGNLYAQSRGLDAPVVVLQPVNLEIRSGAGAVLTVSFTRAVATYGAFTLAAGTRIKPAAGDYRLATLEDVSWTAAETGAKTVRCRQVSDAAESPVALNTVNSFVDSPADSNVTINTSDVTVPAAIDATELAARYLAAFAALNSTAAGMAVELVVCDRTEADICDDLSDHCVSSTAEGLFRLGFVSPPVGTTAANAQGAAGDGVARATLQDTYVAYCHPGWQRQFRTDSSNLNAENNYATTMPSAMSACFRAANTIPPENPARPHPILVSYKIIGVEALATAPVRATHEAAGIWQPVLEHTISGGLASLAATFHASPMANGTTKFATRRMAFYLYKNLIALAEPYHKQLASLSNRNGLLSAIDAFLERLLAQEWIAAYTPSQGDWDGDTSQFTVTVAIDETGNMDILTFRPVFGASATAQAA